MKIVDSLREAVLLLCESSKSWAVILYWPTFTTTELFRWCQDHGFTTEYEPKEHWKTYRELKKACPIVDWNEEEPAKNNYCNGECAVLFKTEQEARIAFSKVATEDPNPLNPYNGPMWVIAMLVNDSGKFTQER